MLGLLELLSLLAGGLTDWFDNLLPDSLVEADLDGDLHGGIEGAGALVRFLDWLYVGRVPLMMLLVVFLAVFGLTGYVLQSVCAGLFGGYLNAWLAVAAALFLAALPLVHFMTGGLYKIMPKDGTTAISQESLGQQHYVMAEPDPMAKVC
nr:MULTISPECIES: OB-fold-containig protein [Eikenella]